MLIAGVAISAAAWLAHADVLQPRDLEPSTGVVTRTDAPAEQPAQRLQIAPPVVPAAGADGRTADAAKGVPELDLMPEAAYGELTEPVTLRTTALWRVMGFGLWRGFANMTMWPGEIGRGFTYEFSSEREWYEAMGTSWLAGFGGGISRMSAGMADVLSLGYFGDTRLARGYPDFVWQGDWLYRETLEPPTMHTTDQPVAPPTAPGAPRSAAQPGTGAATLRSSSSQVRTAPAATPPPPAAADPRLPGATPAGMPR